MHPTDCPAWEYSGYPDKSKLIRKAVRKLLKDLQGRKLNPVGHCADTRRAHHRLFRRLTPPGHSYFAGHYRGESFRCLKFYEVCILSDSRVGTEPQQVQEEMEQLSQEVRDTFSDLDALYQIDDAIMTPGQKLRRVIGMACKLFVSFLTTHPFANGNGHMARFMIWTILGRYGYWPLEWPVDPRPREPFYTNYIKAYRDGQTGPLEQFVLQCVLGTTP